MVQYQEMADDLNVSVLMGIPPPMHTEGNLVPVWRKWRQRFQIYLKATQQGDSTPSDIKTSLLLHAIGSEGLEVYDSFSQVFMRSQEDSESIDHYATALRTLARTCDFGDTRDSLIHDCILLGVANPRLTRWLLAADDPNLHKTLEICRVEEISSAQHRRMTADTPAVSNVNAVHGEMTDWDDDAVSTQLASVQQGQPGAG